MKAAVVTAAGSAPVFADFAEPVAEPGRDELTLVGAGIHQVVRSRVSGRHYSSDGVWPCVPGVDAVARTPDGRTVYTGWVRAPWGTMAERMTAPVGVELPAGCDPLAVAAGTNPGLSGWLPIAAHRAEYGALGTVVVLGATGMSGGLAVAGALAQGAEHVIAAGRNQQALESLGRDGVSTVSLVGDPERVRERLVSAFAATPPSLVLDYLWGPVAEAALTALAGTGDEDRPVEYVEIGSLAGLQAQVPAAALRSRRLRIRGSGLGSTPVEQVMAQLPLFLDRVADGSLVVPYRAFPLSEIGAAWDHAGPGRAVVVPG